MITQSLRDRHIDLWYKVLDHPFVVELYDGTLDLYKFIYYIKQDYNYLVALVKTFSIIAAKAPDLNKARVALDLAYGTVTGELKNYIDILNMLNISLDEVIRTEPNTVNIAYMNHMIATAYEHDFWTGLTATLPCMWTYLDIAERHRSRLEKNKNRIYVKWASTYYSEEYKRLLDLIRNMIDSSGKRVEDLEWVFIRSLKYEYMFWDAAYRLEE
ncbi:MAG: thiaminase II [Sulfolobales archaeon]